MKVCKASQNGMRGGRNSLWERRGSAPRGVGCSNLGLTRNGLLTAREERSSRARSLGRSSRLGAEACFTLPSRSFCGRLFSGGWVLPQAWRGRGGAGCRSITKQTDIGSGLGQALRFFGPAGALDFFCHGAPAWRELPPAGGASPNGRRQGFVTGGFAAGFSAAGTAGSQQAGRRQASRQRRASKRIIRSRPSTVCDGF